jgi:N-acetylneuraminic acid mutarotase
MNPRFIFAIAFMTTLLARAVEWEPLPSLPEGTGNFISGTIGNDLALAGGISWKNDVKEWRDTILRFDAGKKNWSEIGKLPQPLAYAAFGQTKKGLYFVGGSDGKTTSNKIRFLNRRMESETIAEISNPLCYSAFAIADGKIFVICGGTDANDLKTLTNLFYNVDLNTGKTTALPEFPGGNLIIPTASIIGDEIFVFTGATFNSTENRAINSDNAFAYSISKKSWRRIESYPFAVRGLASCALDEHHILLGGGYAENFTDAAFIYDTKTDSYLKTRSMPFRAGLSFIKADGFVYSIGGEDKMRHRSELAFRIRWKELLDETIEK